MADDADDTADTVEEQDEAVGEITLEEATPGAVHVYMLSGGKFMLAAIIVTLSILIVRFPLMVFFDAMGGLPNVFQGVLTAFTLLVLVAFFILFSGWTVNTMWDWE